MTVLETRSETLAAHILNSNASIPPAIARELAAVTVNATTTYACGRPRTITASTAPAAPHISCPKCGVSGGLPVNHKPSNVITCSRCGAKFTHDPATQRPGLTSLGVPVDASASLDLASRIRASRIQPASSLNLGERVRLGRLQAGVVASKRIRE